MTRKAKRRSPFPVIVAAACAVLLCFIILTAVKYIRAELDPHKGQIYINDGNNMVWMTPLEGVSVNKVTENEIVSFGGTLTYTGTDYTTLRGIDVSEHQHEIDWTKVAAADVDFAFIRAGYRGYSKGGLYGDANYTQNIEGALNAGLAVGIYVYSQAITVAEAIEEANLAIDSAKGYNITLPIVFDWENAETGGEAARTDNLDITTRTDCAVAFCETVKAAGYTPCVYFNRHLGYYGYDLSRICDYSFWVAVPGSFPDFYYKTDIWQYSFYESIPGVSTECDVNLIFVPVEKETK